jgi:ornithine cyclodeaminase/alanine dehydrogenase-like protein (mu-crystallin family)
VLVLGRDELRALLTPADVIGALTEAFRALAAGACTVPARSALPVSEDSVLLLMPAVVRDGASGPDSGALGAKLVTYYAGNRERGHPTLYATYVLLDATTGRPLALLEATFLTGIRTGATSALAAGHLARPDCRRAVCFGAGVQAAFQLRCLAAVLPLDHVDVVGRDPDHARAFARAMAAELGIAVDVAGVADAAVRGADVVTCATTSTVPVVRGDVVREGTHVDAVGAFRPVDREVDTATVRRAHVVVDTYAGGLAEAGDILVPMSEGAITRAHVAAELAELVTGARPGRRSPSEITLFKSVGFALEDLATARLAYNRAVASGVGTAVEL